MFNSNNELVVVDDAEGHGDNLPGLLVRKPHVVRRRDHEGVLGCLYYLGGLLSSHLVIEMRLLLISDQFLDGICQVHVVGSVGTCHLTRLEIRLVNTLLTVLEVQAHIIIFESFVKLFVHSLHIRYL
jgi:hypothetical protein